MKRYALIFSLITFGYILGWTGSVIRFGLPPWLHQQGHREPRGPDRMFEGLGLNDDQKEKIRKIRREGREQKNGLREELKAARENFQKTLDSSQDLALLHKAFDRMLASKNALEQAHFNSMMQIHQVLTLDQIKKLGEKRPHRGPGRPGRGGPGPDGPGGADGPDGPPPPED